MKDDNTVCIALRMNNKYKPVFCVVVSGNVRL